MKVSFIIPLYNCLAHTQECVRTLQSSLPSSLPHEIILVDDGSTDGTRAWLATLAPPFRVVLNPHSLGYAGANNRGGAIAQGELLCLLNNDLILAPGWLEPMLAVLRQLPAPGIIGNVQRNARTGAFDHTGIVFDHKAKPTHDRSLPLLTALFPGYRRAIAVTGACMLLSRELWQTLGGFDEGFTNGGEDVDLCFKAIAAGRTNAVALRSTVLHHVSASPGRKRHDEANSRRLTLRWRREIAACTLRPWAQYQLETTWGRTRTPLDLAAALVLFAFCVGLRRSAPVAVQTGVETAIAAELARWDQLLGA